MLAIPLTLAAQNILVMSGLKMVPGSVDVYS